MDGSKRSVIPNYNVEDHVARTARIVNRKSRGFLERFGLTRVDWDVLLAAVEQGKVRTCDIAEFRALVPTAVSRALRNLERRALIERNLRSANKREVKVMATDLGKALVRSVQGELKDANHRFGGNLTDAELETLRRLLNKLTENHDE